MTTLDTSRTVPTREEVRRVEIAIRRKATAPLLGEFRSTFRGHGITFADLREYIPGDEIKRIHWKASARSGKTYVKNFEEERQLRLHIAVDFSRSLFGGYERSALAHCVDCAAFLAAFGIYNRDIVSLSLFGADTLASLPPGSSRFHLKHIINTLLTPHLLSQKTDIKAHLEYLAQTLTKRTAIFILSDFISPPFDTALRKLLRVHDVYGIYFTPFEELPAHGLVLFEDPETGIQREIDCSFPPARNAVQEAVLNKHRSLVQLFARGGGFFLSYHKNTLSTLRALSALKRSHTR